MPLNPDPAIFRAVVSTIVPEAAALDDQGWHDLHQVIDALLRDRPESLKRQLRVFLRAIQWLPVVRYGRPFTRLRPAARTRVLAHLENDRIQKVRVGFWGLRTIALAGYYGRRPSAPARAAARWRKNSRLCAGKACASPCWRKGPVCATMSSPAASWRWPARSTKTAAAF